MQQVKFESESALAMPGANYMLFDGVTSVFGTLGMAKYALTHPLRVFWPVLALT